MKPKQFMLIAGEASGDMLAAELVNALHAKVVQVESEPSADVQPLHGPLAPRFFGAGGPCMAAAGVELAVDMTPYAVVGFSDVVKKYLPLRRVFRHLFQLAVEQQPDAIIGVDYGGFNLRFEHAIRKYARSRLDSFHSWNPKLIQYVSPQVWASRPGRAYQLAQDIDLLLSIFPFEKKWYAQRVPELPVEFVGHPMVERFSSYDSQSPSGHTQTAPIVNHKSQMLLLPGSRTNELQRHLPVMLGALNLIRAKQPAICAKAIFPDNALVQMAKTLGAPPDLEIQIGDLPRALAQADVAIASTGTVTMECAFFGVPTVTLYKTSWSNYEIGKRLVTVKSLTMPNLLANEAIYPEFLQDAATPESVAQAALDLLTNAARRQHIRAKLAEIIASLGGLGANACAAAAIVRLLDKPAVSPSR